MRNILFPFIAVGMILLFSSCQSIATKSVVDRAVFPQSVASGDPGKHDIVIWTRVQPRDTTVIPILNWELSTDDDFKVVVQTGEIKALADDNFTVKVLVDNLEAGQTYFYRFIHEGVQSPIGRTKTLAEKAESIRLAIVNCSKYEGGYFNAYDAITKMDNIDAVVHLGDYIYENPSVFPKSYQKAFEQTGRKHLPEHEILTLSDYRVRFQQYREDTMLQKLHELFPMINIWDDHETANDSWIGGAQGHQVEEGSWEERKKNALKAYFEWIPIRTSKEEPIYRNFEFGGLVNLMMLDTRLCCRTRPARNAAQLDSIAGESTLIGRTQMDWIKSSVETTKAKWNLFGNQVLVSRRYAGPESSYISFDQWTGYPKDRRIFLDYIRENKDKNFLITTGNVHSAYHFLIKDGHDEKDGQLIVHEFAPGSVSSTNADEKGTAEEVRAEQKDLIAQNPHMPWLDITEHGFIVISFTPEKAVVDYFQVSTLYDTKYSLKKAYSVTVEAQP